MTSRAMRPADAGQSPKGTFASLKVCNFRLFFFAQLISATGQWMQTLALAL
ncbi:hypothetical protein [Amycolatopsis sp. NPDC051372]|uniref:hypothetical protein n=1 Tax=Amycolatopsis sp. NPDC051372 TaxID=3155669 RepID=UPI00341731E3